jgi:hypothetical protein
MLPLGICHFVKFVERSDKYHPVKFTAAPVVLKSSIQSSRSPYASVTPETFEQEYSLMMTCPKTELKGAIERTSQRST